MSLERLSVRAGRRAPEPDGLVVCGAGCAAGFGDSA